MGKKLRMLYFHWYDVILKAKDCHERPLSVAERGCSWQSFRLERQALSLIRSTSVAIIIKEEVMQMTDYDHGSHTIHDIKYHFVWLTKYRYKVLTGAISKRLRELLIQYKLKVPYCLICCNELFT